MVHITHFLTVGIREATEQLDPFDTEERVVVGVDRRRAIEQLVEELGSLLPGHRLPDPGLREPVAGDLVPQFSRSSDVPPGGTSSGSYTTLLRANGSTRHK